MDVKELMVNDRVFENTYLKKNCTVQVVEPDRVFYVHQLQHALRLVGLNEMADNLKV